MRRSTVLQAGVLAAVAWLAAGCGSGPLALVVGRVVLDGGPVEGATVMFVPVGDGVPAYGRTDATGQFRMATATGRPGVARGDYVVTVLKIRTTRHTAKTFDPKRLGPGQMVDGPPEDGAVEVVEHVVPKCYGSIGTSGLTATVTGPTRDLVFELVRGQD